MIGVLDGGSAGSNGDIDANPEADMWVDAVWFDMLIQDDRSRWDVEIFTDA